jgi:hypothetical protein
MEDPKFTCPRSIYHVNDWPRHVSAIGKLLDYSGLHLVHNLFGRTKTLTSSWAETTALESKGD